MRMGLIQLEVTSSKKENLRRIVDAIETAEAADLLIFPEYCMGYPTEGMSRGYLKATSEALDGEFVRRVAKECREKRVSAVIPIFEKYGRKVFNTAVFIDHGEVKGGYRKIHLFDAYGYKESKLFHPGKNPVLFKIESITFGIVICYDIRFPELVKSEVMSGARVIVVPSAWFRGPLKEEQWQTLLMARAQENTSYVVGVGNSNAAFVGRSMVVDPLGVKVLELGGGDRVGFYEIDNGQVTEARQKLPVLKQSVPINIHCEQI